MALRTVYKTITEVASGEASSEIYTALEGLPARIHSVWVEVNASKRLRIYVAQDMIVEISLDIDATTQMPIPIDWPLVTGNTVKVAIYDDAGSASTTDVAVTINESVA